MSFNTSVTDLVLTICGTESSEIQNGIPIQGERKIIRNNPYANFSLQKLYYYYTVTIPTDQTNKNDVYAAELQVSLKLNSRKSLFLVAINA
uniref:Uncharacterized protein n=1 Tax=Pyxicephalus adspersus TaxID=30357 RepID=A0AAV2ZLB7_PYXAD|nr:TPA: hypothetical protein GDO54_002551 [Pyxicephalus adspersus]